jgi:hypothetical protein
MPTEMPTENERAWTWLGVCAAIVRSNVHIELPKTIYTRPYYTAKFHKQSWYYTE